MDLLVDKFKEVLSSVLPIVIIVMLLSFTIVDVAQDMMLRFIIGAILLIFGLTIFLFGIDVGMQLIGDNLGRFMSTQTRNSIVMFIAFLVGFAATVAEPDLLILGGQIADATGGTFSETFIVGIVSIGVGLMIALGVLRLIKSFGIKYFFLIIYALIAVLALLSTNEFMAMAFDASGATTGALTTPFILAIGASVSNSKGGASASDDSFGLVGAMSTGPILAVLLLSLIQKGGFQGSGDAYQYTEGIFSPFIHAIGETLFESLIALAPILVIFLIINYLSLKISKQRLKDIFKGVVYTLLGLTVFLIGVNQGFMDMGRFLATELANDHQNLLPIIALVMGLVVVLAEPAVHVLGEQVEDVTGGYINSKLLMGALSIGVGLALTFSMLRIMIPGLQLWHFLLPGFSIALILAFFVPDFFTGLSFDAGGVASGPMTATFILAFSQGVADTLPQADVLVDGFGVIAMVAMTPIIMVQILGLIFKLRTRKVGMD